MLPGVLALFGLAAYAGFASVVYVGLGLWKGGEWAVRWIARHREARVMRIETELDRKQAELRGTMLRLADALGAEAHETRKALIRESFLASGGVPPRPDGS